MHGVAGGGVWLIWGVIYVIMSISYWGRDVIRESSYQGEHTIIVRRGLKIGVVMFIVSEVMFFVGLFWSYFWSSLGGTVEIGSVWVPKGIELMSAYEVPLLNTCILLTSGMSVTWAHNALVVGNRRGVIEGLVVTVILGGIFTAFQLYEYVHGEFKISDGIYGSTFYMLTGFHGLHVLIGTVMLVVSLIRVWRYEQTKEHNVGFEWSSWYWHFVDVVWLLLFIGVYGW